jgi:hypothetical protein
MRELLINGLELADSRPRLESSFFRIAAGDRGPQRAGLQISAKLIRLSGRGCRKAAGFLTVDNGNILARAPQPTR